MRYALACFLSLLTVVGHAAEPTPPATTLDTLLAAFRAAPGVEAHFTEQKNIAMLAAPLESDGVIYYQRPGVLARYVMHPRESFQIIDPKRVRMGDAQHSETLDLSAKPQVRVFVESFVTLLSGDQAALAKTYTIAFTPAIEAHPERWRLQLTPKLAPLDKVIASITLTGSGIVLSEMRVLEKGGDETITTFTSVNTKRSFTNDEKAKLFKP